MQSIKAWMAYNSENLSKNTFAFVHNLDIILTAENQHRYQAGRRQKAIPCP